jgi:hypothetical protein
VNLPTGCGYWVCVGARAQRRTNYERELLAGAGRTLRTMARIARITALYRLPGRVGRRNWRHRFGAKKTRERRRLHYLRATTNIARSASVFLKQNVVKDHFTGAVAHGGIAATRATVPAHSSTKLIRGDAE